MLIKLPPQVRLLGASSLSAARIPSMKFGPAPAFSSSRPVPVFTRFFPFRIKFAWLASLPNSRRQFSTRPFRPRPRSESSRANASSFRAAAAAGPKSLIEDEAELSDWVGDLRPSSSYRGRYTSDDESDSGRVRNRSNKSGRDRDRDRDRFSMKRRRESDSDELGESNRSRNRGRVNSFSRGSRWRFDNGGGNDGNSKKGRSERDLGSRIDGRGKRGTKGFIRDDVDEEDGDGEYGNFKRGRRERSSGLRTDGMGKRGKRGFVRAHFDEDEGGDDDDDEEAEEEEAAQRKGLMRGFGDLLNDEEEDAGLNDDDDDDDDHRVLERNAAASLGLEKDFIEKSRPSSPAKSDSYLSETRFDQCPISSLSLKAIKDAGYEKMTVVQEATLPVILKGKDVLAKAKTGTGKTVAFLLPSIEVVIKSPPVDRDEKRPPILVLVICPTRELASQAAAEANTLLKYHPAIGVQVIMGGTRLALEQKRMQANPCQILVATPGRLRDHIENTAGFATRLKGVKVLVLDEADHLLDMGFRKDIEKVIAAVPKQRQTLLFSATVPGEVRQICLIALKRDHEFINTVQEGTEETHAKVRQMHLVAPLDMHFPMLYVLLKDHIADNVDYKVLVFCTTAMVTRMVANLLGELSLNVREIHSRKPQSYRTRVSDEFRKSKGLILVTSDVSARGVDYPDVTLVVQVGLPADREQYIHRLGRTGRKGKEGEGILLLAPWEEFFLSTIKDLPMSKAQVPSVDPDTKKKVQRALSHVEMKNKEAAYQAWLGYYNSNKAVGRDKYRLVELANEFSRSMGLDNPPAIPKLVLGKMGLKNIPGLRSK